MEDFFSKLDHSLGQKKQQERRQAEAESAKLDAVERAVIMAHPILLQYQKALEKRGFQVKYRHSAGSFHFEVMAEQKSLMTLSLAHFDRAQSLPCLGVRIGDKLQYVGGYAFDCCFEASGFEQYLIKTLEEALL